MSENVTQLVQLDAPDDPQHAHQLVTWLRAHGWTEPADTEPYFGGDETVLVTDRLATRGVTLLSADSSLVVPISVHAGWRAYHALENCWPPRCLGCHTRMDEDRYFDTLGEALDSWFHTHAAPIYACEHCGRQVPLTQWDITDSNAFANLAIVGQMLPAANILLDELGNDFGGRWVRIEMRT